MKRSELKRKTGLKRGGNNLKRKTEMQRVEMKKSSAPTPRVIKGQGPTHPRALVAEVERKMFREKARQQRCCQAPGCEDPMAHDWQAHHVVYEQELRRLRAPTHNVRNAMRLCQRCHERHHNRTSPIPLAALSAEQLAYAEEVLGERAMDYLTQRYRT
jgi:5-methylcytosine-specific restriction endonuclease McrA